MTPPAAASTPGRLDQQIETVVDGWSRSGDVTEQTRTRAAETIGRFARRLAAQGIQDWADVTYVHCTGFIEAPTTEGRSAVLPTLHSRRVALRMFFRALRADGVRPDDPTLDITLPPRSSSTARPLTDDEIVLCRTATRLGQVGSASLRPAVIWALAETTAVTSEISALRAHDLDDPHTPRWVRLPGTKRADARLGELSGWGQAVVARHLKNLAVHGMPSDTVLTYNGAATPGQAVAQASVSNTVRATLNNAGLGSEADIKPDSVRNWAARRLYDGGMPVEQVARRLGVRSLDTAAEDINLDWRPEP